MKATSDLIQLEQQREIQNLRLLLAERENSIQRLTDELERTQSDTADQAGKIADQRIEKFLAEAAQPMAFLITQAYLLEQVGKPIQARDVISTAQKLVRTVEKLGAVQVGVIGEMTAYDPNIHLNASSGTPLLPGTPVRIQFVGVQYQGKILRKAAVEKAVGN